MKIAFLSFYGGKVARGIETYVHELGNRLARNHKIIVYQSGPALPGSLYYTEIINICADWGRINELRHLSTMLFFDFNFNNFSRRFYLDYWSLAQKHFAQECLNILSSDTDIVVSVGSGWVSFLAKNWCRKNHKKLIISGQSGPGWDDRINLLCRPDSFVALTNYQAGWAKNNGFGVRIDKIPNGVDLEKFNPKIKPIKILLPKPIFLCVAALESGKHVDATIKAVAGLPKGSLIVLGKGRLQKEIEDLGSKFLPGRFLLTSVSHDKISPYYCACDVVTMLPPLTESFGIVFLEGLAANKPVVTSDDPPRREIVGKAGIFVDFNSIGDYTRGLQQVLETKWENLPRKQAEKFSWDKIAEQYNKLFELL